MKKRKKSCIAWMLCLAMVCSSIPAFAKIAREDISVGTLTGAKVGPTAGDSWTYQKQNAPAAVGQTEMLTVPITIPSNAPAGTLNVSISSAILDVNQASLYLVVDVKGLLYSFELTKRVSGSTIQSTIQTDAFVRQNDAKVYLYLAAPRTANGGSVLVSVQRPAPSSFGADTVLAVGEYDIAKQGKGAAPIEMAVGAAGLLSVDTIYCISQNGTERIRVMLQKDSVMGLAIKSDDIVVGVEYARDRKVYINALTKEPVLTREEMFEIFTALDFSFMRDPSESSWLAQQVPLDVQRSIHFS